MKTEQKAPKVRFKGFTDAWEQRKFGDMCSIVTKQTGFDYTKTIKNSLLTKASEDTLPYLQTKNFTGTSINYNTDYYIPKSVAKEFPKINLDEKCILFSIVGASVGNIGYFPGDKHCFLSGAICVSKLLKQDDAEYLYHFMCSKSGQDQIHTCTKGGAQATVTIEDIRDFNVILPSKSERIKIGTFLSEIDSLITLHQRKLDTLKKIKKSMLQKMFPKNGSLYPEIRFKGFTDAWEQRKFSKFTFPAGEKNKNDLPLEPYAITNEHGFIAQSEAHDDFGYMQNVDRTMYIIVKPNSFAYNPARINVGSLGYYEGTENVIVSSLYEVFQTADYVDDVFLNYWFKTKNFMDWIAKLQEGSVRQYFYYDKLCECKMSMPSVAEQQQIGSYFRNLDNLITLHQRKLDTLKKTKKSMLQKMFI